MDILNTVKEVNKKRFALEKHPARELDLEQKIYYLYGLALLMNVDDEIHEKEKEYLATLISLFELPEERLNEFIVFAKNPDKKIIFEMPKFFTNDVFKYVFIMDCIFLAYKDGMLKGNEKGLIYEYGKLLKVNRSDIKLLFNLFKKIKKRNTEDISKIKLKDGTIDVSIFQHLFNYYKKNLYIKKQRKGKDTNQSRKKILSALTEKLKNEGELFFAPFGEGQSNKRIVKEGNEYFLLETQYSLKNSKLKNKMKKLMALSKSADPINDPVGFNKIFETMDEVFSNPENLKSWSTSKKKLSFREVKTYLDIIATMSINSMNKWERYR